MNTSDCFSLAYTYRDCHF